MTISKPSFEKTVTGYKLEFEDEDIIVSLDRVTDDGVGELSVIHNNGQGNILLLPRTSVNLLAERTLTGISNKLSKRLELDWQTIIDYAAHYTIEATREGSPLENIDEEPENPKLEYLLYPILLKNQPTTIFSPGGFGKSTLADLIAVSIQFNICVLDWMPSTGNVLYLDWESDSETHKKYIKAIKAGLEIENEHEHIRYMRCDTDLTKIIDKVYKVVVENEVVLCIIDSQMAATASGRPGADAAQISSMYYNALRTLPCASLTIDHVSKSAMEGNAINPYGSVVKANRARSQFEMKQYQEAGEDTVEMALFHTKFNLGRKLKPIGIRVNYYNNDDVLESIVFDKTMIEDSPELSKSLPLKDQIKYFLKGGLSTVKEIAEYLDKNEDSIRTTLNRNKETFVGVDGKWGLLHNT